MANILYSHIDFLQLHAKTRPTATSTLHVYTKYMPGQICPPNWAIKPYMPIA